ncbi:2952_t:CDS:2 [Diversispora eburnea]|uniref:2952_t:CDS:1 n=1 Tax=Diversispora eburnea TaxID=1213867 RepID=A0A9N8V4C9_9GLOM|nr:2952_t:CDS:2 [Diversispora eburnea]
MERRLIPSEKDNSIEGWNINSGHNKLQLDIHITFHNNFQDKFKLVGLEAVSDNKHVVVRVRRNNKKDPVNFEIINMMTKRLIYAKAPSIDKFASYKWSYQKNGDFIIVLKEPKYRAFIFSTTTHTYKLKNMIELTNFDNCIITLNGKLLVITKRVRYVLIQWDLENLEFEQQYILDWPLKPSTIDVQMNFDETLLAVTGKSPKDYPINDFIDKIYVYSTERGVLLKKYIYEDEVTVNKVYFIASKVGERLLILSSDDTNPNRCEMMDPYTLENPVDTRILFRHSEEYFDPFIVKDDDVIGVSEGQLWIQSLIKDDWINYLRSALKDYNEINSPSNGPILEKMIKDASEIFKYKSQDDDSEWAEREPLRKETFEGHLFRWILDCGQERIMLEAHRFDPDNGNWKPVGNPRNILPESHIEKEEVDPIFVVQCKLLNNEDLAIITPMGLFIWTVLPSKGIRLLYFWGDTEITYRKSYLGVAIILNKIQNYKLVFTGHTLPPPDFDHILNSYERFEIGRDAGKTYPFRELLLDYIEVHALLAYHGELLLKRMIFNHKDNWIEMLCDECVKKYLDDFIQLGFLSIIIASFPPLCQRHPSFVNKFMAKTALEIPLFTRDEVINNLSTASHLQACKSEIQIYEASHISRVLKYIQSASSNFAKNHPYYHVFFTALFIPYWPFLIYQFYQKAYNPDLYFQPTITLAIPMPKYATYPKNTRGCWDFIYPIKSPFNNLATANEVYKWWNGEALLNFKWNTYGKYYYYSLWLLYTIFLASFAIVATIPGDILDWNVAKGLLITTIALSGLHLLLEIRQFTIIPKTYITNFWNFFDIAAFLLPMISSIFWLQEKEMPVGIVTLSILMLEVKFLLFFRAIRFFGVYFAIILGAGARVFSFLLILGIIVIAFAHSLHLLLRPAESISLSTPTYNDDPNNPWNMVDTMYSTTSNGTISDSAVLTTLPGYDTNLFMDMETSLLAVYLMLNGRAIDAKNNHEAYLQQKAEIELVYLFPHQRRSKSWFPELIYYEAHVDQVRKTVRQVTAGDATTGGELPRLSPQLLRLLEMNEAESKSQEKRRIKEEEREKIDKMLETIEKLKVLLPQVQEATENAS